MSRGFPCFTDLAASHPPSCAVCRMFTTLFGLKNGNTYCTCRCHAYSSRVSAPGPIWLNVKDGSRSQCRLDPVATTGSLPGDSHGLALTFKDVQEAFGLDSDDLRCCPAGADRGRDSFGKRGTPCCCPHDSSPWPSPKPAASVTRGPSTPPDRTVSAYYVCAGKFIFFRIAWKRGSERRGSETSNEFTNVIRPSRCLGSFLQP